MRILYGVVAGAALLAASTASAQTDDFTPVDGWYAGIAGGLNAPEPKNLSSGLASPRIKFKDGLALGVSGGYKWSDGLRTELEFNYGDGKARDVNSNAFPLVGKQHDYAVMANLVWDFANIGRWTPYVGVGIGFSWMDWARIGQVSTGTFYDGTSTKFAWQGIAGIAYNVSQNLQVTLDYRYKGSGGHSYTSTNGASTLSGYNATANRVMLGLRYAFGAPAAKAVEPPPPPPPPPAPPPEAKAPPPPPPAEQKFLVFFDFDKSNLRADAQKVVGEAANYAKTKGKVQIIDTGHTDTSGSVAYNMGLSERRAKAVQKELNRLGIPSSEITVRWKGKSEPLVQTGDGVKEPQNRRVEIVLE